MGKGPLTDARAIAAAAEAGPLDAIAPEPLVKALARAVVSLNERVRELEELEEPWVAKRGKYAHEAGCGAGPDEPCTCSPPFPIPKEEYNKAHAGVYALCGMTLWRMEALVKLADDFEETERRTRMPVLDADGNVVGEVVEVRVKP